MTIYNQDDEFFSNQDRTLQFILDATTDLPDLSTVTEIEWEMTKDATLNPILSKTLTGGGITIVDSPNRIIDVEIEDTDLDQIEGQYEHMLRITAAGKKAPVAVGHLTIRRSHITT